MSGSTVDPDESLLVPVTDVDAVVVEGSLTLVREGVAGAISALGTVTDLDEVLRFFHGSILLRSCANLHSVGQQVADSTKEERGGN